MAELKSTANQPASLGAAAAARMRRPFELPLTGLTTAAVILVIIGVIGFIAALAAGESQRVWLTWLVNLLFFAGIAQGAVVISCAYYLVNGRWAGTAQYRLAEAFWPFLLLAVVLFIGVFIGRDQIFPWILHPDEKKADWLNVPFLFTRDWLMLIILALLTWWFVDRSRTPKAAAWQLSTSEIEMPPPALRRLSPIIAILYCFFYSFLAFDLISSLSPKWHSTLFGWWYFETCFWSGIAAMAFTAVWMRPRLPAGNTFDRPRVRHDLGKFLFAFSVFWIYLGFAQYLVIWYGDIPSETFFIVVRWWHHPWEVLSWAAPILMWAVPFVVLMGVPPKKSPRILGAVALGGLIGTWILNYILVMPSIYPSRLPFGWVEVVITAGFLGAFLLCSVPGLQRVAEAAAYPEDIEVEEVG